VIKEISVLLKLFIKENIKFILIQCKTAIKQLYRCRCGRLYGCHQVRPIATAMHAGRLNVDVGARRLPAADSASVISQRSGSLARGAAILTGPVELVRHALAPLTEVAVKVAVHARPLVCSDIEIGDLMMSSLKNHEIQNVI